MADEHCDVIVVGAGPAGLATALGLAHFGIRVTLVDSDPEPSAFRAMRGLKLRAMEILRQWGCDAEIAAAATPGSTLRVQVRPRLYEPGGPTVVVDFGSLDDASPTGGAMIGQDALEPILRAAIARTGGVDCRYGWTAGRPVQDDEGVGLEIADRDGRQVRLAAHYLVAADGRHSPIRAELAIAKCDAMTLGHQLAARIRLPEDPPGDPSTDSFLLLEPPQMHAMVQRLGAGRYEIGIPLAPAADVLSCTGDAEDVVRHTLRGAAVGAVDRWAVWHAEAFVAERFAEGRIFLVGDAAATTTPAAGFGVSLGIETAHNLVWKLAYVTTGKAPPALLASYDAERRPAAERIVAFTKSRLGTAPRPDPVTGLLISDEATFGVQLNGRMTSPIIASETHHPPTAEDDFVPTGAPGTRAPHFSIDGTSVLDRFGRGFVLVGARNWSEQARAAALDFVAADPAAAKLYGIGDTGAALIRPDGIVAWRTPDDRGDLGAALALSTGS